jgi:hypothetical protein
LEESALRVVAAWHAALNAGEVDRLLTLSDPDIEIGGPRGTARGAEVLREWIGRANVRLDPGRVFHRAEAVVVEQAAEWRDAGTGSLTGRATVASVFVVHNMRVAQVTRYPELALALAATGLESQDETELSTSPSDPVTLRLDEPHGS